MEPACLKPGHPHASLRFPAAAKRRGSLRAGSGAGARAVLPAEGWHIAPPCLTSVPFNISSCTSET